LGDHIVWICHRVSNCPRVLEDFVVVSTRVSLVAEKMYLAVGLVFDELQAIPFVPTLRKGIKADLPSDGENEP